MTATTATVSEWLSVVRRARLGRTVKGIAYALATRCNNDGTRLFTGIARLSVECEVTPKVMKQTLRTLREVGLIGLVHASRGLGETNEYRLTLPTDGQLVVLTPAAHDLEVARVAASLRGKWKDLRGTSYPAGGSDLRGTSYPAGDDLRGSSNTAGEPEPTEPAGYGEPRREAPAGYGEDNLRGTPYPATSPLPRQVTTTSPTDTDLRTAVTATREAEAATKPDSDDSGGKRPARPSGCPSHGPAFAAGRRPDGKPACPLCRAGAPPSPPGEHLARVIPLNRSLEAS